MTRPLISVIMPVFNGAKFLPEAIESIRIQNYTPLETIIVDDGSTDETARVVAGLGEDIRYIYQCNKGPAAARNKGLAIARGEVIAFLDVDDVWPPKKLHTQVSRLIDDPNLGVVLGRIKFIRLPGAPDLQIQAAGDTVVDVHLGSAVFRRFVFDTVGFFDETLRYSEDRDWFFRAIEQSVPMTIIQQTTLYYRLHSANMTRSKDANFFQIIQVLKKSLDRRRQRDGGPARPLMKLSVFDEAQKRSDGKL